MGSIHESGMCPGEENGNPPQYSYLGNPMDGGVSQATLAHGVPKGQTQLSAKKDLFLKFTNHSQPSPKIS